MLFNRCPFVLQYFSVIAKIFSLNLLELFPVCFSCKINFDPSHSSIGSDDKKIVFEENFFLWDDETPEAETKITGDLGYLLRDLSPVILVPKAFSSKYISSEKSYNSLLFDKIARSTL